jgi:FkbM family methyltransferase
MQNMKFRGYKLFYTNRAAAESMVRQIDDFPSFFTPTGERPLIIDCGANIGVSMLEWKTRWPHAEVLCFEPDPFAFKALQKNVDANDIPGVKCVNAALADCDGTTILYGDISSSGDARGNSIDPAWADRGDQAKTTVSCKRLSAYLEGAEQRVITEIADHLPRVQAMYVEVHETDESRAYNSSEQIEQILKTAGFTIEAQSRYAEHALPAYLADWQDEVGARQTELLCWR